MRNHVLVLFVFLFSITQNVFSQVNEQDSLALVALYESTDGDNWLNNDHWLTGNIDAWYGVVVSGDRVTSLELDNDDAGQCCNGNNLVGFIPPSLGNLGALTLLDLSWNEQLTGHLPQSIGLLTNLETLRIIFAGLSGEIPTEISLLSNLTTLNLQGNMLTGSIPVELSALSRLRVLDLLGNQLEGTIPSELGDLTRLYFFNLAGNRLTGEIPENLKHLTRVNYFHLAGNTLTGSIPTWIGDLTDLEILLIGRNSLSGSIPKTIGDLTRLRTLDVHANILEGSIPLEITNLQDLGQPGLGSFTFSDNNICEPSNVEWTSWKEGRHIESSGISCFTGLVSNFRFIDEAQVPFIDIEDRRISFNLPETNITDLVATFEIEDGLRLELNGIWQVSGATSNDYTSPLVFDVKSSDGDQLGSWEVVVTRENIVSGILESEYNALVDFYNKSNGHNWRNSTNWLSEKTVDSWFGVYIKNQRVTEIYFNDDGGLSNVGGNDLGGNLTNEIGELKSLRLLELSSNNISGEIPSSLFDLNQLSYLNLSNNSFSGEISAALSNLRRLEVLYLRRNNFSGELPSFSGLENLTWFDAERNSLNGELPSSLSELQSLRGLVLGNNLINGQIPQELGALTKLEELRLNDNLLSGELPSQIGNLKMLFRLDLSNNMLLGSIPLAIIDLSLLGSEEWAPFDFENTNLCEPSDQAYLDWKEGRSIVKSGLTCEEEHSLYTDSLALVALYESTNGDNWTNNENWLTGDINTWYGVSLVDNRVADLELDENNLVGTIPNAFTTLDQLNDLSLRENYLSGSIPENIDRMSALRALDLFGNDFTGTIPSNIGALDQLEVLNLFGSKISGTIPYEIGDLTNLVELNLVADLSGEIPASFSNLQQLRELNLASNQLTGQIPEFIYALSELRQLTLSSNQFEGTISESVGDLINVETIDFRNNRLEGSIPSSIGNLGQLRRLSLNSNMLNGEIPTEIGLLSSLTGLYLDDNNLNGAIPSEIGNLNNLEDLFLSSNNLTGGLPSSLGQLLKLERLKIDDNGLFGPIPIELAQLSLLGIGSFDEFSYLNTNLCEPDRVEWVNWKEGRNVLGSDIICGDADIYSFFIVGFDEVGTINRELGEISLNLPQAPLESLIAVFEVSTSAMVMINGVAQNSGITVNDFSQPLVYEVVSEDQQSTSSWMITITNEPLVNGVFQSDLDALIALYNATVGDIWDVNSNWLSENPVDEWYGVKVDNGRVTELNLFTPNDNCCGNNLAGQLPTELGNLNELRSLRLGSNDISGLIPPSIWGLKNLEVLHMANNNFTGEVSNEIQNLSKLTELNLSFNQLSGIIPSEIGELDDLQDLKLVNNQLTGSMPKELGNLSKLIILNLDNNMLTGSIPPELGQLSRLIGLGVGNNPIGSSIPLEILGITELRGLNIDNTDINGVLPAEIGQLTNLFSLDISNTNISGNLPPEIGDLSSLEIMNLSNTQLQGPIPLEITGLDILANEPFPHYNFDFSNTMLCEPSDQTYLDWKEGRNIISNGFSCDDLGSGLDFLSFTIPEQYEEPTIDIENDSVRIYVTCLQDFTFEPSFSVNGFSEVFVNDQLQASEVSSVNLSSPVAYTIVNENQEEAEWIVEVIKLNTIAGVETYGNANYSCNDSNGGLGVSAINFDSGTSFNIDQGYSYEWSNDDFVTNISTSSFISGLLGGDYQLRVTEDLTGCQITEAVTVIDSTQYFDLKATVTPQTNCDSPNGSITLTEFDYFIFSFPLPDDRITFSWRHGAVGEELTSLAAGIYTVDITDNSSGCTYEKSFTVQGQTLSGTIQATSNNVTSCESNNGSVSASVDGTTDGHDFEWYSGGGAIGSPISTSATVSSLGAGSYTVKVSETGTDCFSTRTVSVGNETQTIDVNLTAVNNTSCSSPNGEVEITTLEIDGEERTSTSGYSIAWSLDRSFDEVLSTRDEMDDLAADTYYIRVSQSGTGCTSPIRSIEVEDQLTIPTIAITTQENMTCTEVGNGMATITSETAGLTIAWYEGDEEILLPNQSSSQLTGLSSGSYSAVVTNSTTGCTTKSTFAIGEALPQITLTTSTTANTHCINENGTAAITSIVVNGQVAMDYNAFSIAWSMTEDFATIASTEESVQSLAAGDYYVRVTLDSVSCISPITKATVTNQLAEVAITLINTEIDKPGEEVTGSLEITAAEGATINWYAGEEATGTVIGMTPTLASIDAGQYTVEVTDPNSGCIATATYEVEADSRVEQTITFDLPESLYQDELPLTFAASSDQNLMITYTIAAGAGEIVEGQLINAAPGELTIVASSQSTEAIAVGEATATMTINGNYDLSGVVTGASNGQPIDGEMIAFNEAQEEISRTAFTAGAYAVTNLREGSYYLKVEPSTGFTDVATITYYQSALTFSSADLITLENDMILDLSVIAAPAQGTGTGSITGAVTLTSGRSRIVIGRTLDGTPVQDIAVYLIDRQTDALVVRAITNASGVFTFNNIATGQYSFVIDGIGLDVADLEADIDYDQTEGALEISAAIGTGGLTVEYAVVSGTEEELLKDISIYPNPAREILHIEDAQNRIKAIQLMNLTGQLTRTFEPSNTGQYDISTLTNGMYMIRIELEDRQLVHTKVVIRD